jgi:preprotein translocase subunit SecG
MATALIVIHVLICAGLIIAILLQSGKGSDLGAAFGGSSQTLFGSSGAVPFLNKVTAGVAIAFMITSLSLAFLASKPAKPLDLERGKGKTRQEKPLQSGGQEKAGTGIPSDTKTER